MTGENSYAADPQPGGRDPAPGDLGLVQSFINTRWNLRDPEHSETFTNGAALGHWLRSRGLLAGKSRLSKDDVERAVTVREGLRALAFANNDHRLDPRAIEAMRRASRGVATQIRIEPDGPQFVPEAKASLDAAIGALFAIVARAMIDGSWQRLKACPGRDCGWVFYDSSRNKSARWCSMQVCGDREKSRAYYRRKISQEG
jgi:predicted RNA-binding Zn ribbon-like protein